MKPLNYSDFIFGVDLPFFLLYIVVLLQLESPPEVEK